MTLRDKFKEAVEDESIRQGLPLKSSERKQRTEDGKILLRQLHVEIRAVADAIASTIPDLPEDKVLRVMGQPAKLICRISDDQFVALMIDQKQLVSVLTGKGGKETLKNIRANHLSDIELHFGPLIDWEPSDNQG